MASSAMADQPYIHAENPQERHNEHDVQTTVADASVEGEADQYYPYCAAYSSPEP